METVLKNVLCQIDKMKMLGKNIGSESINFLSLLKKYETYVSDNSLTDTYGDKINKLIFQMESKCCKITK
tara:strand:- start:11 stop:220 length:210 start_codon:yes stop_codon:yes gene_type:complete